MRLNASALQLACRMNWLRSWLPRTPSGRQSPRPVATGTSAARLEQSAADWRGRDAMGFNPRKAQAAGIDVAQVLESWQGYLLAERDKARENPQLYAPVVERLKIAVMQRPHAMSVSWETLSPLPKDIPAITVHATSYEAARNKLTLPALLDQRLKRQLANEMQRVGLYKLTLEGRREANERAIEADVWVADMGLGT